ncbi:MAG: hypothetical protein QOF77_190 [Solirubrobacteraceae bacterium]|nr:hypothetical protein [Solirubrobacteraceae bacterium]
MAQAEGRAWWAEVEHLREPLERERAARQPDAVRRTVRIRGQAIAGTSARRLHAAEAPPPRRLDPLPRERPRRSAPERLGSRPDRIAAWAVVFGLLMAIVAAATAKSATLPVRHLGAGSAPALTAPAPAARPSALVVLPR